MKKSFVFLSIFIAFNATAKMTLDDVMNNLGSETKIHSVSPEQIEQEWKTNSRLPSDNESSKRYGWVYQCKSDRAITHTEIREKYYSRGYRSSGADDRDTKSVWCSPYKKILLDS